MSDTGKYIPAIGTKGSYQLLTPFDALVSVNEQYTLKSVRTISDWLAANEDVKNLVYATYNISAAYNQDLQNDVEILGLQGERGAWVYVPIEYVKCYPVTNGIPYRGLSIVVPLQPIPVDTDLSGLLSQINQLCLATLGFGVTPQAIETTRVVMVSPEADTALKVDRAVAANSSTPYAQILTLNNQLNTALAKVTALEQHIHAHP